MLLCNSLFTVEMKLILILVQYSLTDEAKNQYGAENIVVYSSLFVNLYYALSDYKHKTQMKLICLKPDEKVRNKEANNFCDSLAIYL